MEYRFNLRSLNMKVRKVIIPQGKSRFSNADIKLLVKNTMKADNQKALSKKMLSAELLHSTIKSKAVSMVKIKGLGK